MFGVGVCVYGGYGSSSHVQVLESGVPCWELLRALRLTCATPAERKLHGHRAAAGQAISTTHDVRWELTTHVPQTSKISIRHLQKSDLCITNLLQGHWYRFQSASIVHDFSTKFESVCWSKYQDETSMVHLWAGM